MIGAVQELEDELAAFRTARVEAASTESDHEVADVEAALEAGEALTGEQLAQEVIPLPSRQHTWISRTNGKHCID